MALPTIAFSSATGSDTAASGAGPATALFGTAAATAASTVVTLLVDNPDLSGVPTDGSAAMFIVSSSGRRWSKITGVNNTVGVKTVTVETAYANTESGKSWGIGGKRATLDGSTQLGLDMRGGWQIDIQDAQTTTVNFVIRPNAVASTESRMYSSATTKDSTGSVTGPIISTSTNNVFGLDVGSANNLVIQGLYFKSTAGTPGYGIAPQTVGNGLNITLIDCKFDGFNIGVSDIDSGNNVTIKPLTLDRVEVVNCTVGGIQKAGNSNLKMTNCLIKNCNTSSSNSGYGLGAVQGDVYAHGCIFDGNGKYGATITCQANTSVVLENCAFLNTVAVSTTGHGVGVATSSTAGAFALKNCILYGNSKFGVALTGDTAVEALINENNAYGSNTSGDRSVFPAGTGDVALTANPFVSSTDYGLNSTAGGGTACKGAAAAWLGTAQAAGDIGPIPSGGTTTTTTGFVVRRSINAGGAPSPVASW